MARKQRLVLIGLLALPFVAQAQTYSRTEVITYHDNPTKWVLGQTASLTCTASVPTSTACDNNPANGSDVASSTTFDSAYALPLTQLSFGKLQQTLTYDTTSAVNTGQRGTLKTIKDGNNNVTTLSSWKRGIPQNIKYPITPESPTGAVQSAVVNNNGEIDSVTDETGAKTCYTYDPMGRLTSITYPSETTLGVCDTSKWAVTTLTFQPVAVAEYGIPAGHWTQTVQTGTGRHFQYFDALWRPLIVRDDDSSQITATRRVTRNEYDHEGRVTFTSYPVADGTPPAIGIWTEYDAIGRVTSVSQNSELTSTSNPGGLLTTLTEYLPGFKTRTTNPKLQQTTTSYLAYDQPTTDWPLAIDHAGVANTDITRDAFGKSLSIKRRSPGGTLSLTRSYVYDAYQQLCLSVEPETKATVQDYDAAGNLSWSASGQPFTAATACTTARAGATNKVSRTYDARNRVKTLSFPSPGFGNTTYAYTPDGLPSSMVADNGTVSMVADNGTVSNVVMGTATTNYVYNRRRLPIRETLITPELNWPVDYGYSNNGHLALQSWHGLSIDYLPNALGQPTKAGTYASGVSYYPNGAIKQFTYGNGIVHTMTQNARQLPSRSTDCTLAGTCVVANRILDLGYTFDANANVEAITDYTAEARQTRGMTYDALDRLTQTTSVPFGTAIYTYDVLDNLTRAKVGASAYVAPRDQFYCYNATTQRLDFLRNTSCSGGAEIALDYDDQGNLKSKNNRQYIFDFGNRLRAIAGGIPSIATAYAYDGQGRRVRDHVGGVSKRSQYLQNGQLAMTGDDRAGKVNEYIYLGGSLVATRERDVPTAVYTTKYYHTDALGSPIAITNPSKVAILTNEFEPYGKVVNHAEIDGPLFTGHVQDASSGLSYMQQRYYDPMIGRFLSVDPVTANSGTGANFNRYWYADDNPYKFKDPDGRQTAPVGMPPLRQEQMVPIPVQQQWRAAEERAAPKVLYASGSLVSAKVGGPTLSASGEAGKYTVVVGKDGLSATGSKGSARVDTPLGSASTDGKPTSGVSGGNKATAININIGTSNSKSAETIANIPMTKIATPWGSVAWGSDKNGNYAAEIGGGAKAQAGFEKPKAEE